MADSVFFPPQCFYTPKNHQNKTDVLEESQRIRKYLCDLKGQAVPCHLSEGRYPEDAILQKKHNLRDALQFLVWPSLMLFGGATLVGLVMLTHYLAHLCNEIILEEGLEDGQSTTGQSKLYRFLPWRPWSPSIDGEY